MRTRSRERAEFGNSSERKSQKISLLHSTAFWRRHILLEADFLKKAVDYSDWFSPPCVQKDGRVRFKSSSIGWIYMLRGGETRCSAVWSAHLFWVQRAIGSNPVTLMWYSHNGAEVQSPVAYPRSGRQAKSAHKRKRKLKSLFCNPLSLVFFYI